MCTDGRGRSAVSGRLLRSNPVRSDGNLYDEFAELEDELTNQLRDAVDPLGAIISGLLK